MLHYLAMSESSGQDDDRANRRERRAPRKPSESNSSGRVTKQLQSPVIIYIESPKTVHVEAEDFKEVVQRLTGNRDFDDLGQGHSAEELTRSSNPSHQSQGAPGQLSSINPRHALDEYLERLDEDESSSQPSPNLGLFPTAGLVRGIAPERGLQWATRPDSNASSSSRPAKPGRGTAFKST